MAADPDEDRALSAAGETGCPACLSKRPSVFVERHRDRIGGKEYTLSRCPGCGVVWSEPREAVGAEWYVKAAPLRGREGRPDPESDWRYAQFFSDRVPAGRLLDVGCGNGGFMRLAAARGFSPTGFDYDERVAAQARAAGLDAQATEFSAFVEGRRDAEFDAMTLFDVLEHTPEPAWFFGRLLRLLKPRAYVAVTLPNALRPLPWGREEHDFPPHHFTRWTPEAMRGFLEARGFEIVRQEAGTLKLRYLSDHFFFYKLMPPAIAAARRILFGKPKEGATLSELYERQGGGALADKGRRQRWVDAARRGFQWTTAPVWAVAKAYYQLREPRSGDCLYTLARRR